MSKSTGRPSVCSRLKAERGARSHSEAIKQLIREHKVLERSDKGALPKPKRFQGIRLTVCGVR